MGRLAKLPGVPYDSRRIREGREERGVFRNKHSSVFRRPYLALALRCQEVRIRISFTDFSFKRV